jgi:prepilin-type N-terminal cleavage/methylation domain-containing protein
MFDSVVFGGSELGMSHKKAFTLIELLVVIAIIAVLLSVLFPALRYVKSVGQRSICQGRLSDIGKGLYFYSERYDGLIPLPASDPAIAYPAIRAPYEVCQLPEGSTKKVWLNLGALYAAELIASGRQLYCPATEGWREEYEKMQIAPDGSYVAWGTLPLQYCMASGWQHIETKKGYVFWPQSRHRLMQSEYNSILNASARYEVGYPATPAKYADLDPLKALSCDYSMHAVKGSGYNVNVVFGDTHVNMQKTPVDPQTGRNWYIYQSSPPSDEPPGRWAEVKTSRYMFALQP